MEEHHVYHHHHHHYHYHYTYPFPLGLPPNAPPDNEPLNQEAAGHDNEEPAAEDDDEEEQEHSEKGDTDDQHNPENRSPSPAQEYDEVPGVNRPGFALFDSALACLDLDDLSLEAQTRFTNTQSNSDDHQEGPPRKKARMSSHPKQNKKPREGNHITIIDEARVVCTGRGFRVVNCDPSGPQVDICWRVPGHRNIWLARVGYAGGSRKKFRTLVVAQAPPDMPLLSVLNAPLDEENTLSLIECSCGEQNYDDFESGGGQIVPGEPWSSEFLYALGKMVGFEVVRG